MFMVEELWTLGELASRVAAALSSGYDGQSSGRVSDVPDVRTIRYYTTLGLLDRPAAMRGRIALYADRHLLQLVAIKRLQAEGRSLAEIQVQLAGASDATLRCLANVPDAEFWRRLPLQPTLPPPATAGSRPPNGRPADLARADVARADLARADLARADLARADLARADLARADLARADLARADLARADRYEADQNSADLFQAVPLPSGAMLLVPSREPLRDADLAALRAAARPLDEAVARLPKGSQ